MGQAADRPRPNGGSVLVTDVNYDNSWWPLIYDQWNERGDRQQTHEREFQFYRKQLAGEAGPVLEVACGTGSILLRLLRQGIDIRGFDCAAGMLAVLRRKAADLGLDDIDRRVCCQDMVDFCYDQSFAAILIPASSFMLLPTQAAQIACLERIRAHLVPGGRLLMNFYIPSLAGDLLAHVSPSPSLEDIRRIHSIPKQTAESASGSKRSSIWASRLSTTSGFLPTTEKQRYSPHDGAVDLQGRISAIVAPSRI